MSKITTINLFEFSVFYNFDGDFDIVSTVKKIAADTYINGASESEIVFLYLFIKTQINFGDLTLYLTYDHDQRNYAPPPLTGQV
jgi:hypothetical protein